MKSVLCVRTLIGILLAICMPFISPAQQKEDLALTDSMLKELQAETEDTNTVKLLNAIAFGYLNIDHDKSMEYTRSALEIAEQIAFKSGIASSTHIMGIVHSIKGNMPEALKSQLAALKLFEELKNKKSVSRCYFSIATVYLIEDNFPDAIKYYSLAIKVKQEIGDKAGIASCYINLGNVYNVMKNYPDALLNYRLSLRIANEIKDRSQVALAMDNIGNVYNLQGNPSEALKNVQAALKIFEEINDKNGVANSHKGLGNIYSSLKNYSEALKSFSIAEKRMAVMNDNFGLADVYGGMGAAYFDQGQYASAEKYYNKALQLGAQMGSMSIVKAANEGLSEAYARSGDYKKSLEAYKASVVASDSMFNEETTRKAVQAQMQHDFDIKEAAVTVQQAKKDAAHKLKLQQKNILIYGSLAALLACLVIGFLLIRQNKLKASKQRIELEQKQLRAQMNPHFIFNCLNSIQHYIVASDIKNANKYLSGFALIMRQTLENSKETNITLRKEITYLKNYLSLELMLFEDKFTYEISCAENINVDSTEIPTMIIQPFIENSIRHGLAYLKEKKGFLHAQFYKKDGCLFCEIDDNGIGREQSQKLKNNSEMVYESQGMELTRQRLELMKKNNGSDYYIDIVDKKNGFGEADGTTVTIKFPSET